MARRFATIDDDIAYLKIMIDVLMQRTPSKPDGLPEAVSTSDWVKIREMRTERKALCAQRWESVTNAHERRALEQRVGEIARRVKYTS